MAQGVGSDRAIGRQSQAQGVEPVRSSGRPREPRGLTARPAGQRAVLARSIYGQADGVEQGARSARAINSKGDWSNTP
eukprot:1554825-Heterocapsa_arctica.AAC.1